MRPSTVIAHMKIIDQMVESVTLHENLAKRLRDKADEFLQYGQANCEHEFAPPLKGFEHEGGTCRYCRVNQIYAPTQRLSWLNRQNVQGQREAAAGRQLRPEKTQSLDDFPLCEQDNTDMIKQLRG